MHHLVLAVALALPSLVPQPPAGEPGAKTAPPASPPAPAKAPQDAGPQRWKGEIIVPGAKLEFSVAFTRDAEGKASATLSIPAQGLSDGPLRDVSASDRKLAFTLGEPMPRAAWAFFTVEIAEDGQTAKGTMKQNGMDLPVTMSRMAEGEQVGPRRPQTPKPPFPYAQREVSYLNPFDSAKLAGTLTIPEEAKFGKGPHPAVLLITGSGPQDRDETLFGHKPFAVIADRLTREGVAVLRIDDRGVGGSTSPKLGAETTEDFVGDVLTGVAYLKGEADIDPKRIGLIGHSEGGMIAPMAASKAPADIAFIVMLAGTGVPGRDVLLSQMKAGAKAEGMDPAMIEAQEAAQTEVLRLLAENAEEAAIKRAIQRLARVQMGLPAEGDIPADKAMQLDLAVKGGMRSLGAPWMKAFIRLDPREALRKVTCPVLAINGSLDFQVTPELNLPEIRKALAEAKNADATVEAIPGLNHLFQTAKTGGFSEYAQIEETFAPVALDKIASWVRTHAGLAKP